MKQINLGPIATVEIDGELFAGQLVDGYLFMKTGTKLIPPGAEIKIIKQGANLPTGQAGRLHPDELLTTAPNTAFERWQVATIGNYYREDESLYDDLQQFHYFDKNKPYDE